MLMVIKVAPLPPTVSKTENRYLAYSRDEYKNLADEQVANIEKTVGATLEQLWVYDGKDGRVFRKIIIK